MKQVIRNLAVLFALVSVADVVSAQIEFEYYESLNGLSGAALKTAIHNLCREKYELPEKSITTMYTNLRDHFKTTDCRTIDGTDYWWDMYSSELKPLSQTFSECAYQREHAFPKSWWKDSSQSSDVEYTSAYCDMHHLYPSNGSANQSKSNWPLGEVNPDASNLFNNGVTKTGPAKEGIIYGLDESVAISIARVFEPADEYKGDFARTYMYMVTAYQDLQWNEGTLWMVQRNAYPTLTDWANALIGRWHRNDPVSEKETNRNDAVEAIQKNRNPFIDMPNLYEYVWGDSISRPLNLRTTKKAGNWAVIPSLPEEVEEECVFYSDTFLGSTGDCTITNVGDLSFDVWVNTSNYGWKGSGYSSNKKNVADSWLYTPEIDLAKATEVKMSFSHALNYAAPSYMHVYIVTANGTQYEITSDLTWPAGNGWAFVDSGEYDMSHFANQKVKVAFRYTSDSAYAGTWEIKNLVIDGKHMRENSAVTSVHEIDSDCAPVEYFTIDGQRVDSVPAKGLVICRQGSRVEKRVIK